MELDELKKSWNALDEQLKKDFYGLLFGVAPQADNLFAEVDSCYQRLKMRASSHKPP